MSRTYKDLPRWVVEKRYGVPVKKDAKSIILDERYEKSYVFEKAFYYKTDSPMVEFFKDFLEKNHYNYSIRNVVGYRYKWSNYSSDFYSSHPYLYGGSNRRKTYFLNFDVGLNVVEEDEFKKLSSMEQGLYEEYGVFVKVHFTKEMKKWNDLSRDYARKIGETETTEQYVPWRKETHSYKSFPSCGDYDCWWCNVSPKRYPTRAQLKRELRELSKEAFEFLED